MAVSANALTTTTNFKTALRVSGSGDDTLIESLIDRATEWIHGRTGRLLKARNYNGASGTHATTTTTAEDYLYVNGSPDSVNERGQGVIYLPQYPIQKPGVANVLDVQLAVLTARDTGANGAGDTWDTSSLVEGRDYIVDYQKGIITLNAGVFVTGHKNYRIKCTAGYQTGSAQPYVPADLEQLCIDLAAQVYKDKRNLQSESIGTWSRSFNTQAGDPLIEDVLARYTRLTL